MLLSSGRAWGAHPNHYTTIWTHPLFPRPGRTSHIFSVADLGGSKFLRVPVRTPFRQKECGNPELEKGIAGIATHQGQKRIIRGTEERDPKVGCHESGVPPAQWCPDSFHFQNEKGGDSLVESQATNKKEDSAPFFCPKSTGQLSTHLSQVFRAGGPELVASVVAGFLPTRRRRS